MEKNKAYIISAWEIGMYECDNWVGRVDCVGVVEIVTISQSPWLLYTDDDDDNVDDVDDDDDDGAVVLMKGVVNSFSFSELLLLLVVLLLEVLWLTVPLPVLVDDPLKGLHASE